jgi:hypothetical protein
LNSSLLSSTQVSSGCFSAINQQKTALQWERGRVAINRLLFAMNDGTAMVKFRWSVVAAQGYASQSDLDQLLDAGIMMTGIALV